MFQMTKMNPNWLIGIMSATTTYNRRTTNPDPVLLIRAMIAMITTRNSGNATTTVTKDSASIPSVSIFFRISRRSSFSNCSAFTRKYGLSWPPLVDVVTTPCRKSENLEDGERWAAFRIGMLRTSRNRAATNAATTAPTAANVVFIHATARYSSGRSRMCALRRLSSSSGSLPVRAWTNFPNMRQATCAFGGRLTFTGLAPFGSFTMWAPFSDSSPGRNRFVFVSVPRVSSFSNAELANGLAPCLDGLHDCMVLPAHFFPDSLRGLLGVLVVLDNELRDLSEVQHALLQHVVDNVDPALELRLHLLMSHVLHFHDLIEQERVPLVHERVRRGVPLVVRVRDEVVRPLPQRRSNEVVHVDLAARLAVGSPLAHAGPRRPWDPVLVGEVDFPGVLDGHDLRARSDEEGGAVQGRSLSAGRPSADHHRLAALHRDPEIRDHLGARGPKLDEFDRGEGLLLVPPDRERRTSGCDFLAVRRLDTMPFHRGAVQDRVRDGDLLAASLPEHDGE